MTKIFPLPGGVSMWWVVVAVESSCTPLCTVSMGILPPELRGHGGIGEIHRRATEAFMPHINKDDRLLVFMYNRRSGDFIPRTSRCSADPQLQAKLLLSFPWINIREEVPGVDDFLLGLGLETHFLDRRLAGMAARRAPHEPVPVPIYDC